MLDRREREYLTFLWWKTVLEVRFVRDKILEGDGEMKTINEALRKLANLPKLSAMMLNFSGVTFLQGGAFGPFITAYKLFKESGKPLILTGVHEDVMEKFEISMLNRLFRFEDSIPKALKVLRS